MSPNLIPTAEPFFFPGNRIGCLLVHGITATPKEVRYLGAHLAEEGCSVLGVRLPGHATTPEDMIRTRWRDWVASVEDGWHLLRGMTDQVFVVGHSMGGALALYFASRYPVAGVVAMSTPYDIPATGVRRLLIHVLKPMSWFMPYLKKTPPIWFNLEAYKERIVYPVGVVRSLHELKLLLREMRRSLPDVQVPALLMHSRDDDFVPPVNTANIYDHLGSEDKELIWVEKSDHVITEDGDRERVFRAAWDFIKRVSETA